MAERLVISRDQVLYAVKTRLADVNLTAKRTVRPYTCDVINHLLEELEELESYAQSTSGLISDCKTAESETDEKPMIDHSIITRPILRCSLCKAEVSRKDLFCHGCGAALVHPAPKNQMTGRNSG